jgi:hypothetical protein
VSAPVPSQKGGPWDFHAAKILCLIEGSKHEHYSRDHLKNGQCVRLWQGKFETAQVVATDAVTTARAFLAAGAELIHMVGLGWRQKRRGRQRRHDAR